MRAIRSILVTCALAAPALDAPSAAAQAIGARVAAVRDGTVRFTFATRPSVCGDGDTWTVGGNFVVSPPMSGRGRNDGRLCVHGPARVDIARAGGETVSIRLRLAVRTGDAGSGDVDLGTVSAPEAARWLLGEAARASGRNAEQALAGAAVADSIPLWSDLARLARDTARSRGVRERATFWIGSYDDPAARASLRSLAADTSLGDGTRSSAIIAIGGDDIEPGDVTWLEQQYVAAPPKVRDAILLAVSQSDAPVASRWLSERATDDTQSLHDREQALFWLGQGHAPTSVLTALYPRLTEPALRRHFAFVLSQRSDTEAVDRLIDVARSDADVSVRKQALFWLGQSKDPRALAYIRALVLK